jgi:hypothetical protein
MAMVVDPPERQVEGRDQTLPQFTVNLPRDVRRIAEIDGEHECRPTSPPCSSGETNSMMPSGLTIVAEDLATLAAILDRLTPTFAEPGPRVLRQRGGAWTRMLLVPSQWCVRKGGPIAPEVLEAAALAYALGAVEVSAMSFELTVRPLRRLVLLSQPDLS